MFLTFSGFKCIINKRWHDGTSVKLSFYYLMEGEVHEMPLVGWECIHLMTCKAVKTWSSRFDYLFKEYVLDKARSAPVSVFSDSFPPSGLSSHKIIALQWNHCLRFASRARFVYHELQIILKFSVQHLILVVYVICILSLLRINHFSHVENFNHPTLNMQFCLHSYAILH
jgi:hypothetical protein